MALEYPADWRIVTVDQLKANSRSAITIGPFGSRMKADCYVPLGIPVIRGNNITDTKSFTDDFVFITKEKAAEFPSCHVFDGDLVFPHRGLIGKVGIVTGELRFVISSSLMKLTPNRDIVDPFYLFYYFRSPMGRNELLKNASQVGTPGIATPLASLRSLQVILPPIEEQHAIARILGALDDKIELNRQMNATLEAMARALFKSWFVDFDPVREKMEGRQPAEMDAVTAALFPDSFEDSPLGKVPKGWYYAQLGNIIELAYGKALKEEIRQPGQIPVYGSNGQVGWHNELLVKGPGIVVGRKGNPGIVAWVPTDFFPIDTTFYVVPKSPTTCLHYLYYALSGMNLASLGADSAVPGLNRNIAYLSNILIPFSSIISSFEIIIESLFKQIAYNLTQNRSLTAIRDALLPKLLSGEIQVRGDVEVKVLV